MEINNSLGKRACFTYKISITYRKRGEIHGIRRGIRPNWVDILNLSGYLPKLECYAESVGVSIQIRVIFRMFPCIK